MFEDIRMDLGKSDFPLNTEAVKFLEKIVSDKTYLSRLLHKDGMILKYAPADLQDDEELVKIAIAQNPKSVRFASKRMREKYSVTEIEHLDPVFESNLNKIYNEECNRNRASNKPDISEILLKNLKQFKTYFEVIDAMSQTHKIDIGDNALALRTSISLKSIFDIFVYFDRVGNITDVKKMAAGTPVPVVYKKVDDFANFNDLNI